MGWKKRFEDVFAGDDDARRINAEPRPDNPKWPSWEGVWKFRYDSDSRLLNRVVNRTRHPLILRRSGSMSMRIKILASTKEQFPTPGPYKTIDIVEKEALYQVGDMTHYGGPAHATPRFGQDS